MTRARLLFVDDDPSVLDGLRNRFRRQQAHWDMTFVGSGEAALEVLAGSPIDLVISDMRMPGMDGAELLRRVALAYPAIARLALTGYVEESGEEKVRELAHAFLYTPCDGSTLRATIDEMLSQDRR